MTNLQIAFTENYTQNSLTMTMEIEKEKNLTT